MGIFISVIILILITLIQLFMQLTPGTLALFYHYALGKNNSIKADNFCLHYILGSEVFIGGIWLVVYLIMFNLIGNVPDTVSRVIPWVFVGIFIAEAIAGLFFYYRKGRFTELFMPRSLTRGIETKAKAVKSRSDAFILGFIVGAFELVFTLPIYVVGVAALLQTTLLPRAPIIILYIIISVIPLFIIRRLYRTDHNLAEIEKKRIKHKSFIRIGMCVTFAALAAVMVWAGVLNG